MSKWWVCQSGCGGCVKVGVVDVSKWVWWMCQSGCGGCVKVGVVGVSKWVWYIIHLNFYSEVLTMSELALEIQHVCKHCQES